METTILDIIQTTLNSFDFSYCIIVNILTYIVIKILDTLNKDKEVSKCTKKLVLLFSIFFTGVVYYIIGQDVKLLFNSAIIAPVSWSFILKPICKKFNVDYKEIDNTITK